MDRVTRIVLFVLVVYNVIVGISIGVLTTKPFVVLIFLAAAFFLLFFYLAVLLREKYRIRAFRKKNRELIEKAQSEMSITK